MNRKIVVLVYLGLVAAFLLGALTHALIQSSARISSRGMIRSIGVDVYRDQNLTQLLTEIDWGILDSGGSKTFPAWIKNTGNDAQKLVMWTEAWQPANASDWIILTWNYDGSWIPVKASIYVVFTLSVNPLITGITNFSFDIWIKGVY